jgi:D-alanyl-D-alanine carboxypeptidase/D-alanyl-D-alanine-endopeptidase (penicillin-binding protein 4)
MPMIGTMSLRMRGAVFVREQVAGGRREMVMGSVVRIARVMASVAVVVAMAGAACGQDLQEAVRGLVASKKLGDAKVGICLMDAHSKSVLASVNAGETFIPASNMKLLTSGAAMMVLGPDFAFRTEFLLDGDRLVIRGAGDPSLGDPEVLRRSESKMTVDDVVRSLAGALPKANVNTIREIVVDDRVFDRQFVHPTWNPDNLHLAYSAQVAGINFHANVLNVFPRPNPSGGTPLFTTQPSAAWLRVDASRAKTAAKGNNSVWLMREGDGSNSFVMRGEVAKASQQPISVTINDPPMWFGQLFATALGEAQVTITGAAGAAETAAAGLPPTAVRLAGETEALDGGRVLAVVSTPIDEVMRRCNVDSENLYAESLMKRMGHAVTHEPGSWNNGATVLRMMLTQELGPDAASTTTIADGSGLSRENRVSPSVLARWLTDIAGKEWADQYVDSLAAPGRGTLERRFQGAKLTNEVRAKSGYIKGVRSLSGYVTDPTSGDRLVFVVLINNLPMGGFEAAHNEARELHEDIVKLLDRTLTRRAERKAEMAR